MPAKAKKTLLMEAMAHRSSPADDFIQAAQAVPVTQEEPPKEASAVKPEVVAVEEVVPEVPEPSPAPKRRKPYRKEEDKKTNKILVPITDKQRQLIHMASYVMDVSAAEVVRRSIDEYFKAHGDDLQERLTRQVGA